MSTCAQKCPVLFVRFSGGGDAVVANLREAVSGVQGLQLEVCPSPAALSLLKRQAFGLLVLHVTESGSAAAAAALVKAAAGLAYPIETLVIGEPGQSEQGLTLLRAGAADYLERPLDLRRLALRIDLLTLRARRQPATRPESVNLVRERAGEDDFLYCPTVAMGSIMDQVARVAPIATTVLIQGETGTGKTRLAQVIHNLSSRREKRFLVVNCAALPANLIESELFGHVKGAFTGADRNRTGKFAEAAGGTLFLDEIDALPLEMQAKLLRVVEDKVFEPVGSNDSIPMTARLITACNTTLTEAVRAGRFRSDLFFRINVVSFEMPPLREQAMVFPMLVRHFVEKLSSEVGRDITGVTPEAMAALTEYQWPGNVRELRNAIERAVALRLGGEIDFDDLPDAVRNGPQRALNSALTETAEMPALVEASRLTLAETKAEAETAMILSTLQRNRHNKARTATELGISRETLYKKLHRYGLFNEVA